MIRVRELKYRVGLGLNTVTSIEVYIRSTLSEPGLRFARQNA